MEDRDTVIGKVKEAIQIQRKREEKTFNALWVTIATRSKRWKTRKKSAIRELHCSKEGKEKKCGVGLGVFHKRPGHEAAQRIHDAAGMRKEREAQAAAIIDRIEWVTKCGGSCRNAGKGCCPPRCGDHRRGGLHEGSIIVVQGLVGKVTSPCHWKGVFDRAPRFFKPECGKGGRPIPRPILTPTKPRRQLKKTLMSNNKNKLPWLGTMEKTQSNRYLKWKNSW